MPVSKAAIDVVFDALAQSKSSLLKRELADQRKLSWLTAEVTLTLSPTLNLTLTLTPSPYSNPNPDPHPHLHPNPNPDPDQIPTA